MRLIYTFFTILLVLMTSAQCQKTAVDRFNKGNTLNSQGKYDEAILAYDKVIQLIPDYASAWYNKGIALKALGRTSESDAAFAKSKVLAKLFSEANISLPSPSFGLNITEIIGTCSQYYCPGYCPWYYNPSCYMPLTSPVVTAPGNQPDGNAIDVVSFLHHQINEDPFGFEPWGNVFL
jgi:tetratricopeptide (TPR) repeat protein